MRVESELAYVLHTRPYRETSLLVDLFSRHHGRLRVVAKGSRSGATKRSSKQLMPFALLQLSWTGRGELKNLVASESIAGLPLLKAERLYSGFYLNELLIRLLAEHDPHEQLFDHYQWVTSQLAEASCLEALLRQFEMQLLEEIGYELVLNVDVETGELIRAEAWYWYDPLRGVAEQQPPPGIVDKTSSQKMAWFSGESLLAITAADFSAPAVRQDAKRLLRLALKPHLGDKPLRSRELFQSMEHSG